MTTLRHGVYMMQRHLLNLWRQPIWIAVTLVQPVIWLLLYGALFKSVTRSRSAAARGSSGGGPS